MAIDASGVSVYVHMLERWTQSARRYLYRIPDRPELLCYGSGENGWGVQTNQKAFAVFATLGAHAGYRPSRGGMTQDELRDTALRLLRYSLRSHIAGDYHCTDGTKWGHTWISALGVERMMHGIAALEPWLTAEDRALLRNVLLSESDWLVDEYPVVAGLYAKDRNNKPESNLWNGSLLVRTAEMYPDSPRAEMYREKGLQFLINSVSVPSDAGNMTLKDGKTVAERFVGANFFETMALNHHDYLNVGYMVICLSNMAMLHFTFKRIGKTAPDSLYHHMAELWDVVKLCTFADGRLLRIGGDTRARYTYCQDYVLPSWLMVKDILNDPDCDRFEAGWLRQIQHEMQANGDDSFLSGRCASLIEDSPLYYTRLESDRAVALSMALAWKPLLGIVPEKKENRTEGNRSRGNGAIREEEGRGQSWHDEFHGAYLHRSPRRIASWVWESAEKPQGLCLPADASDMAEWRENLSVRVSGIGRTTAQKLERNGGHSFPGGFVTSGRMLVHTQDLLAEGQADHPLARSHIACAALPDNTHMIVIQYTKALERRSYVREVKGLHLLMPNDLFNGKRRTYYGHKGASLIEGAGGVAEIVPMGSTWINIDDRLGVVAVYGADELFIRRPGRRQIGLKEKAVNAGLEGMLYADEICAPCEIGLKSMDPGQVLVDAGFVLQAGCNHMDTASLSAACSSSDCLRKGLLRTVRVRGADGHMYLLAANFGDRSEAIPLEGVAEVCNVASGERFGPGDGGHPELILPPEQALLLRIEK